MERWRVKGGNAEVGDSWKRGRGRSAHGGFGLV